MPKRRSPSSFFPVSTLNCLFHLHSCKRQWGIGRRPSPTVKQSLRQFDGGSDSPIAHPSLIELALFSYSHTPRHCDPLRFRYSFHIHLRRSPKFGMIYSPAKESAYCIERRNSRQSLFSSGWNIRRKGGTKKNSADSETVRLVLCFQLRKSVRHSISKSLTAALTPTEK